MNILLINPIYNRLSESKDLRKNRYSLGLAVLQSEFRKNDVNCDILDLNYQKDGVIQSKSYELIVNNFVYLGKYNYIGITSFSNNFVNAILLAEEIKRQNPNAIIYLGGAHVSACASNIVKKFPFIDFVNIGEGEKSVKYIIDYFRGIISKESVPNIVYYDDFQVKHTYTTKLLTKEELPILSPQVELLGVDRSLLFNDSADIEGGRGCPFNCIFCSTKNFWQRKCRMKPLDKILFEMDQLHKECGIHHFSITHDLFTANKNFIERFCDAMKERNYTWTCSARFDTISCSIINKMYESGCQDVFYGIETGSQELQKMINKNLDLDKVDEIIKFCNAKHYMHTTAFIIGFPFETPTQLDETLSLVFRYHGSPYTKVRTEILTPEVGTKVYLDYYDKIKYDSFYVMNNYDYVQIEKEKEVFLIQTFPDIFSHFYYIHNRYFSIYALKFIEKALRFLCVNYYKMFGVAFYKQGSIIKILSNIVMKSFDTMNEFDYQECIEYFEKKLKEYTNKDSDLMEVFDYENLLKKIKIKALKTGEVHTTISVSKPYPALDAHDILGYEVGRYIYSIQAKANLPHTYRVDLKISQKECYDIHVE